MDRRTESEPRRPAELPDGRSNDRIKRVGCWLDKRHVAPWTWRLQHADRAHRLLMPFQGGWSPETTVTSWLITQAITGPPWGLFREALHSERGVEALRSCL